MNFKFPDKKIGDRTWFLNDKDSVKFGEIKLINISITEQKISVWYGISCGEDEVHTVNEAQVLDNEKRIPSPKFNIGDNVRYTFSTKGQSIVTTSGVIDRIEIQVIEDTIEHCYYMDDDNSFWILEDEIIGFHEPSIEMNMCEAEFSVGG